MLESWIKPYMTDLPDHARTILMMMTDFNVYTGYYSKITKSFYIFWPPDAATDPNNVIYPETYKISQNAVVAWMYYNKEIVKEEISKS